MDTKTTTLRALPLVLLFSFLILNSCEKDAGNEAFEQSDNSEFLKKKAKCPTLEFDVRGTGADKKEAKANAEESALKVCYNRCRNSDCDDGHCNFDKVTLSKHDKGRTDDGEYYHIAVAKCKCDCQDCEDEKAIALGAFTGMAPNKSDAVAKAIEAAEAHCMTQECPLYPCKDKEEMCRFDKAEISEPELHGEEGAWTASVKLLSCDCNCEEGEVPDDGTN